MADPDPFADAAFVSRLQKLLSLLASEQPGEADAARRKLIDHLAHQRLSLTDVAQRLPPGGVAGGRLGGPSFSQGARDMGLERQLHIARLSRQEAEADTKRALQHIAELRHTLQTAGHDVARARQGQARLRLVAGSGWCMVVVVGALAIAQRLHVEGLAQGQQMVAAGQHLLTAEQSAPPSDNALQLAPGERLGTVLVQDLPIRLSPNDDAGVRAFLNRGMRVVVTQQARVGVQTWLLIRSVTGSGWVRGGDVLHR